MSASTAGAIKARIEALGLGLTAYRDGAPTNAAGELAVPYPFAVIHDGIGTEWEKHGDTGDPNADEAVTELVQVDLYERARTLTGGGKSTVSEQYALPEAIVNGLRSSTQLSVRGNRVFGVQSTRARRWPVADNIVRHTIDVTVRRQSGRA